MTEPETQPISKNLWWVIPGKLAGVRKPTAAEIAELKASDVDCKTLKTGKMATSNEFEFSKALLAHAIQFSQNNPKSLNDLIARHQLLLQEIQTLNRLQEVSLNDAPKKSFYDHI